MIIKALAIIGAFFMILCTLVVIFAILVTIGRKIREKEIENYIENEEEL